MYVVDLEGRGYINVTSDPIGVDSFVWSPDGQAIAFRSERDGNSEIYVSGVSGNGPWNVTNHPADDRNPAWLDIGAVVRLAIGAAMDEAGLVAGGARGTPLADETPADY